jgi:hypothetical protein
MTHIIEPPQSACIPTDKDPFGEGWKKEMHKLTKKQIIGIAADFGLHNEALIRKAAFRVQCRNFAVFSASTRIDVKDVLKHLGYDSQGDEKLPF